MASQVLSADSHVLEPPDLWTTRMQAKFRDRAPHLIHEYNGQTGDFLACEGLRPFNPTSLGNAGIGWNTTADAQLATAAAARARTPRARRRRTQHSMNPIGDPHLT